MIEGSDCPPGTRFPSDLDHAARFLPGGMLSSLVTYADLLEYHEPRAGRFTLMRPHGSQVAAVACFKVEADHLFIEYLARNAAFESERPVRAGSVLVAAVEFFALALGRPFLRLESVDDPATLRWYKIQGFAPAGDPYEDPEWGRLHPMEKRVEPLGGVWR